MKSPAFQFYPDDFRGGKAGLMTAEEVGVYVQLLCLDWSQDGFAFERERLAQWSGLPPKRFDKAWQRVSECFPVSEDGRHRNPRLQKEREKQAAWREKSRRGGHKGAQARWSPPPSPSVSPIDDTPVSISSLQSPVTTKPSRVKKPREPRGAVKSHWLLPSSLVWEAKNGAGSFPWGEAGNQLLPLRDHHAPEVIASHLREYLATTKPDFVNLARFCKTFAQHNPVLPTDDFGTPLTTTWGSAQ